jgi:F-box and WD-40 domain protein 1/11
MSCILRGHTDILLDPVMLLPYEITAQIFAELDGQDLRNASKVSLPWRGTSRDQHVWRQAFQKSWEPPKRLNDLPLAVGGKGTGMPDQFKQDWSKMYQARQQIEQNWKVGRAVGTYLNGHTDSVYCTQFDEYVTGASSH